MQNSVWQNAINHAKDKKQENTALYMTTTGWISPKYKDLLEIDKQPNRRFLFTGENANHQVY